MHVYSYIQYPYTTGCISVWILYIHMFGRSSDAPQLYAALLPHICYMLTVVHAYKIAHTGFMTISRLEINLCARSNNSNILCVM